MKQVFTKMLFALFLCIGSRVSATTYTFTGSGSWSLSSNWDINGIPPNPLPANDTININGSAEAYLDVNQTLLTLTQLNINSSKTLIINSPITFTIYDSLINNGTLINNGILVLNTGANFVNVDLITNNGTINNSGKLNNGNSYNGSVASLSNAGTINNNGILFNQRGGISNSGALNNNPGASIINEFKSTLENFSSFTNNGLIDNNGILNNNSTLDNNDTLSNSYVLNNKGTLNNNTAEPLTITKIQVHSQMISPLTTMERL